MLAIKACWWKQICLPVAEMHNEGEEKMNFVQPIRDRNLVRDIADYFKNNNQRNYLMFIFGLYTGRRISDILKLRIKDVKDKDHILIKEQKTGKMMRLDFNPELKRALQEYCAGKDPNEYFIKSQKGVNRPITRSTAYTILRNAAKQFNLDQIGCHTLRKTFGYHLYMNNGKNVVLVMNALGHTDQSVTLRYIGIECETINKAIMALKF